MLNLLASRQCLEKEQSIYKNFNPPRATHVPAHSRCSQDAALLAEDPDNPSNNLPNGENLSRSLCGVKLLQSKTADWVGKLYQEVLNNRRFIFSNSLFNLIL